MEDLDIIKQIENVLTVELKKLERIGDTSIGFIVNQNNQVTGLALYDCETKKLNRINHILIELKKLTKLNLGRNKLGEISSLKGLLNIEELYLHNNNLSDISELKELKKLTKLYLGGNQLSEISELKELKKLTILSIGSNQISDIIALKELTNLTELDLSINQLSDISALKYLKKLTKLYIGSNKLSNISALKYLKNLTELYLGNNQLKDIGALKYLKNLTELDLYHNQISKISALKELKNLTNLYLYNNQLSEITALRELKNLRILDLKKNPIKKLPQWITDFNMEIQWKVNGDKGSITFYDNPLKSPPIEIVKQGKEAIKNYFEQLKRQGKDYIYEAKMMLVGEPGAGKTTLMNKLFDRNYPVPNTGQKSTLGIEVRSNWEFNKDNKKFKSHIWDFGGQQIQYMLHQFFLTSDCLYILMAEKRKELANFDYWLNIINLLGKRSPVIVLFNEINIDTAASFIYDEKKYKELFPELDTQKLDINLSKMDDGRFDFLINTSKEKLIHLEHIGKEVPAKWVDIRKELEERREQRHITQEEYFNICSIYEIDKEEDRLLILKYFHLLGIVLHFSEDPNLRNTLFLDPNWTVDAVYSVLTDPTIENNKGIFELSDIDKIWSKKGYGNHEREKLLQLMLKDKFDLCYKIPGTENKYIVPSLLPKIKPEYDWENKDNLQFRFQYPFMPKGIVSRLIVRLNEYIEEGKVWNEGTVFHKNEARAQVIEKLTVKEGLKIIEIRITGKPDDRKEFLTIIREEIHKIQNSSFPNLPYYQMVPCICRECIDNKEPEFYDYAGLENLLNNGVDKKQCPRKGIMVDIFNMIDAVYDKKKKEIVENEEVISPTTGLKQKIKIFLASSSELADERKEFEIFIGRKNKELLDKNIFLELEIWEDFLDAMSKTRLQDEYNKAIKECDIFVSLFFTKVGKYTEEEFETAYKNFKSSNKQKYIYTYFKDAEISTGEITDSILTLLQFKKKLDYLGHFYTRYKNTAELLLHFEKQLQKILPNI